MQMEINLLTATIDVLKKDPGVNLERLKSSEKTVVIDAVRTKHALSDLLQRNVVPAEQLLSLSGNATKRRKISGHQRANPGYIHRKSRNIRLSKDQIGNGEARHSRFGESHPAT